jgi:hypothetical protein
MVTNYQARAALLQVGLFVTVDAMIKAMEPTQPAFQAWEFANNFYRNSEFINTLGRWSRFIEYRDRRSIHSCGINRRIKRKSWQS